MTDAREWLASVTEAARTVAALAAYEEAVRSRAAISPTSYGVSVSASVADRMASIDAMLSRDDPSAAACATLAEADAVFSGLSRVGGHEAESAAVLRLVHQDLMRKSDVAKMLGVSASTLRRRYEYGVDWLDAHGLAHAKAGTGSAQM